MYLCLLTTSMPNEEHLRREATAITLSGCHFSGFITGHFTQEIEGPRPLCSKISHWSERRRWSNFTSH